MSARDSLRCRRSFAEVSSIRDAAAAAPDRQPAGSSRQQAAAERSVCWSALFSLERSLQVKIPESPSDEIVLQIDGDDPFQTKSKNSSYRCASVCADAAAAARQESHCLTWR